MKFVNFGFCCTSCTRNCFQCPLCTSPLSVNPVEITRSEEQPTAQTGPFVLCCPYCNWSSKEIGIQLEKATNIYTQLSRIRNGGGVLKSAKERVKDLAQINKPKLARDDDGLHEKDKNPPADTDFDRETQFTALKSFYTSRLTHSAHAALRLAADIGYRSPSAFA